MLLCSQNGLKLLETTVFVKTEKLKTITISIRANAVKSGNSCYATMWFFGTRNSSYVDSSLLNLPNKANLNARQFVRP